MMKHTSAKGAPSWVLPLCILALLVLQLVVKSGDVRAQQIDILHGETLRAWQSLASLGEAVIKMDPTQKEYSNVLG
ncbi:hypothetical protein [Photobacterium sp. TY1-4]|uniref:hypothetical protein n=1 Tax=Photobacterium sp. TY1-4 TaxID=2899122 RepID=UPI0021BF840B|nr:hypothetical protein [Photobacterium sp. TY1-4]UXI04224.1 hypothetical protein NH461_19180 [Photobacterium sp. TY1-4]